MGTAATRSSGRCEHGHGRSAGGAPGGVDSAGAVTATAYADGPLAFLDKSESRFAAAGGGAAIGSYFGGVTATIVAGALG